MPDPFLLHYRKVAMCTQAVVVGEVGLVTIGTVVR